MRIRIDWFITSSVNLLIAVILLIDKICNVSCVTGSDEKNDVKKCCPYGSSVIFDGDNYSCDATSRYVIDSELYLRNLENIGIPICDGDDNLTDRQFADFYDDEFPNDYCVDLFYGDRNSSDFHKDEKILLQDDDDDEKAEDYENDGKLIRALPTVLFCSNSSRISKKRGNAPTLIKVRRCCPRGEIFRFNNRACLAVEDANDDDNDEERDTSTLSLVRDIGSSDFIHVLRGPPKCQHAIVDFEVNVTDVSIVDGRLQVTMSNSLYDVVDLLATEESACLDGGSSFGKLVVRACRSVDYCRQNACLRKCCGEDEALVNASCQKIPPNLSLSKWHDEVWQIPKTMSNTTKRIMNTTEYGLLIGKPCLYGMYPVLRDEGWYLESDGKVRVPGYKTYEHHQYCTDVFYNTTLVEDGFYPFVCFEDPPAEEKTARTRFIVKAALIIVSCAFLLVTLLVYVCLPMLQNLHGKTLMCHVASLFVAYVCLAMVAIASPDEEGLNTEDEDSVINPTTMCRFLGYTMLFSFLSTFFWLNVMCFDIWWKFGSLRHSGRTNTKRRDDFKRFLFYCLYAWGMAFLLAILALAFDFTKSLPRHIRPGIGYSRCWFTTGKTFYGEIIFFTGPVSIQLLVNLIFFILTARRCSMVKAEIQRRVMVNRSDPRSRRFEADKTKLILNVKLFIVMGVSWVLEIISYFLNNYATSLEWKYEFFYVSDIVNCLQGLFIFFLFVLKKKVFHALRRRFAKGGNRRASTGGIHDPYRVRKSPSSSTILSTFAVSSSP